MEFDKEWNGAPGELPESGAIFMSNKATRKECYKQKLFGLPFGQAPFVQRVKAGMILFLFEFERRELHGVFQACCDGAMNIVPHAFSSSGKQFPAQVKFTTIWRCSPLSENEFCNAIRENYFSAKKFNFGLSERQVKKLLVLFSSKKLKVEPPQRQLVQSELVCTQHSTYNDTNAVSGRSFALTEGEKHNYNKNRSLKPINANEWLRESFRNDFNNGSLAIIKNEKDGQNGHESFEQNNAKELLRESFSNHGKATVCDWLASATLADKHKVESDFEMLHSKEQVGNTLAKVGPLADHDGLMTAEHPVDVEPQPVRTSYLRHSVSTDRRVADDTGFAGIYGLGEERSYGSGFLSPIPSECETFQHSSRMSSCKPGLGVNSSDDSQLQQPSAVHHQGKLDWKSSEYGGGMRMDSVLYASSLAQTTVRNPYPCDPEVPGLNYNRSSSLYDLEFSRLTYNKSPSLGFFNSAYGCSSPPHHSIYTPGNESTPQCLAPNRTNRYPNIVSGPCCNVPFSWPSNSEFASSTIAAAYTEIDSRKFSEREGSFAFSLPKPSLASIPPPKPENYGQPEINESFTYSLSPNRIPDPSTFQYRFALASQVKHDQRLPSLEINEASVSYDPISSDCKSRSPGESYRGKMSMDAEMDQGSQTLYHGYQKKRESVFSRLAFPQEEIEPNNGAYNEDNESSFSLSVNEIMAMLHMSRYQWTKGKNFKLLTKKHEQVAISRGKKQMTSNTKLSKDEVEKTSKEVNINGPLASEENDDVQMAERVPFLDFKRRSKVQKSEDGANVQDNDGITKNDDFSGGQKKRRRLIRPKFCQNEVSGDVSIGINENGTKKSQDDKIPQHIGQEEKNLDIERCLKSKADEIVKSLSLSSREGDNSNEESSQNIHIKVMPFSASCTVDGEESKTLKNADSACTSIQIDLEDKNVGGGRVSNSEAKEEMETGFSVLASKDEDRIATAQNVGIQDVPSPVCHADKTLVAEEGLLFNNLNVDGVSHKNGDNYPGSALEMHREQDETVMISGGSCPISSQVTNVGSSMNHSQASDISKDLDVEERNKLLLFL